MQHSKQSALTTDFHLRLSEFQRQQKKILEKQQPVEQQLLYSLSAMPISISPKQSMIYFSLFLLWFLYLLILYLKKHAQISKNANLPGIVKVHEILLQNSAIGYVFNGFLMVLVIAIGVFNHWKAKEGCLYIFSQTANRLYPYLRFIIKGLFLFSYYFTNANDITSVVLFVGASLVSIFSTLFLQNITLRKDQFCCKSLQFSIIFNITIIISLSIDLIGVNNVSNWNSFLFLSASQLVLSINLLICYFKIGLTIFRHVCTRISMLIFIILYHSLSLAFCVDIIATQKYSYQTTNIYLTSSVIFIVVSMFIYSTYSRIRKQSTYQANQNIKQKIYFMFNKFEQADADEETDCQIRGIIHEHYYQDCRNPQCIVNIKEAYDSKKRKMCSIQKIAQGKTSVVKFYIKCLYQTEMLIGNYSKHFKLDFLQFYYLKFKNVYQVERKIVQLQREYMTFYQRLRLIRLKKHLIQQSNMFSSDLFNKSLNMQDVIQNQKRFSKVQSIIQLIINRNELFWKYLQSSQIHLKQILDVIRPNFNLMNILKKQWELLNNYFHINRRWKFYFICYNIFIKNEKIKPSMIEDFGNSVDYDTIFKNQNYFVDKTTEKEQLFNPIMLFQQNTCFIHTICDEDKMTITKVSNFFQKNFEYQSKEAINSPISILMVPSIHTAHHKKFLSWIKNQKSNNEAYYEIKKNYPLTKKGYIYPCFKFYKRYIKLNGDIEYISMLKSNKKDEQIILMNRNFQIEAITVCLHHKLKMHSGDYVYLQGINLLALIPSLISYSRFECDVQENDQDFFENHDNIGYLKKQNTYNTQKDGDDKQGEDILTQRKNIGLSNIKFYFPTNLQQALQIYKKAVSKKKGEVTFSAIRQLYKYIKTSKSYYKFKLELLIRQRDMQGTIYYQLQINQIQESNRLQELDFQQQKKGGSQQLIRSNDDNNQYNQIDMQLFFSLSKKKHKVMLFPSKNIFLKDQHNKALVEIPHINNISFFIRISLFFLVLFVILQISFQSNMVNTFSILTTQFEQIVIHQKSIHMLNNQYSIQHIQPGNYWQQSFIIIAYTHIVIKNYESEHFQKIIYDRQINTLQLCFPFSSQIDNHLINNYQQEALDQVSIFFKIYQSAISLHQIAEVNPKNTLQMLQYYQFNNYLEPFQQKVTQIKENIIQQFNTNYTRLRYINIILVIISSTIIFCTLIFSFSRLVKVYRGFRELVSILIQIDNSDIKSISRYVDYTKYLFERINSRYYQMGSHSESNSASSSHYRSFQKKSSELRQQQQQRMGSTEANLNKKIKKMEIGSTITKMMFKPSVILLCVILLIGGITLTLNIFAIVTLNQYADFQNLGFQFFRNIEVNNILATGALEKFRNSSLYQYDKYQKYINKAIEVQASEFQVKMVDQNSQFERLVKKLYESNFCRELSYILNETLTEEFADICGFTHVGWCSQIFESLSENNLVKRCETIQNSQLQKGLKNYNNFFLGQVITYFKNEGVLSLTNAVELNDAFKNIDYILIKLIQIWRTESIDKFQFRNNIIIFISLGIIGLNILLITIFIQFYTINSLKNIYQIFREMHEHYIPQWLINKQKIIKAKLVNQGFMKQ